MDRALASLTIIILLTASCNTPIPGPVTLAGFASPAADGSGQPHLSVGPGSEVILSWLEPTQDDYALKFSSLMATGWSDARTVAKGSDWFVNWADIPSVEHLSDDLWAAHWLRYQPDEFYAYDAVMALSVDGGINWQPPSVLHQDGTPTEHGFVTLFSEPDGVGVTWLDGRNLIIDGEYVYEDANGNPVGTSLRYARFSAAGERLDALQLDELVCDCCLPDVALTDGAPVLAYRDRTPGEVRDIIVRRRENDQWQEALLLSPDNWVIAGCPINGPAIAAQGDAVAVAWFSAAGEQPHVRLARSTDGGRSFAEAIEIDTAGSFGYVDVAVLDSGDAIVSWLRSEGEGMALAIRRVSTSGLVGEIQPIANSDTSRPADFPQMVYAGGRLVFAWMDSGGSGELMTGVAELGR